MIKYQLKCARTHEFEGWFRNSVDYDEQAESGLLACPICGTDKVSKAIMAPAIARKSPSRADHHNNGDGRPIVPNPERLAEIRRDIMAASERARAYVEKNFDYVGDKFPEEARKMHYGEADERAIYGEATGREVKELIDEGIGVTPLAPGREKPTKSGKKAEVVKKDPARDLN